MSAEIAVKSDVVIVGAGFGGLEVARALGRRRITTTIIDKENYHLFVPLLYQVASGGLSAAHITRPVRGILRQYDSVHVCQGAVSEVDYKSFRIRLANNQSIDYRYLILATGAQNDYFENAAQRSRLAPGLKSVVQAEAIRSRLLDSFEAAEWCEDETERRRLMTVAVVGGGSTGVEIAGALAQLVNRSMPRTFRNIDTSSARILLLESSERLLSDFPDKVSAYAQDVLSRLGVEVLLDSPLSDLDERGVVLEDNRSIPAATVIWGGGIKATPAAEWLDLEPADEMQRLAVNADLSVPGRQGVFALGDLAHFEERDGLALPPLAQVASQQGKHLGRALAAHINHGDDIPAFRLKNRGNAAIIGRFAAVVDLERFTVRGVAAWLMWAVIHIVLLSGVENRVLVSLQWIWRTVTFRHDARIIDRRAISRNNGHKEAS